MSSNTETTQEKKSRKGMSRRGNHLGTLVSKGVGKPFLARWMYEGKIFSRSTGEKVRSRALARLEELTRPFREKREQKVEERLLERVRELHAVAVREPFPVGQVFLEWVAARRSGVLRESTKNLYAKYASALESWCSENGYADANRLDWEAAEKFLKAKEGEWGASSFNIRISFYAKMWRELARVKGLDPNVWEGHERMKVEEETSREVFALEALPGIWSACRGDMRTLVAIGMHTGLRISDAATLKWSDVDFASGVVSKVQVKTHREVVVPLLPGLRAYLESLERTGEYVSGANARKYASGTLDKEFGELLRGLGYTTSFEDENGKLKIKYSFHSFRHTFVSVALNAGVPPAVVQQIVGHASYAMTLKYFHKDVGALKKAVEEHMPRLV